MMPLTRSASPLVPSTRPGLRNRAVLFVLAGPQEGNVFQLHGTSLWLGRSVQAELSIDDDAISERHAHITRRPDGLYLQDNSSRNGTLVHGEALELPRRLVDGDHVSLGNSILKFSMLDDLEEHELMQLVALTVRDPLTSAYNRRYLMGHLRSELAFAARVGMPVGLLLVDIDHFKRVNDRYGHRVGDVVLRLVAASIQRMLRPYDVLCRYGGEEFVVVARDTSLRNAEILAERVRHHVEAMPFEVAGKAASVTVSVGVTVLSPGVGRGNPEALLHAADQALYAAKDAGRNRIKCSPLKARARETSEPGRHTMPPLAAVGSAEEAALDCRPPPLPRID